MRDHVRFLLGGETQIVRHCPPTLTVLQYLRRQRGRTGTKEGCAEGDCGACTVAVGEVVDGRLRYRAINACIQFLATLDGKQLLTVEDLQGEDGELHPVQQAMVDQHGSQCGFCTPGFVMSLFSLSHRDEEPDRLAIDDALAGNLCRCTGYGPIIAAARQACQGPPNDRFSASRKALIDQLAEIHPEDSVAMVSDEGRYFAPRTLAEALDLLGRYPDACLLAGGTDVGLWVTKQHRHLDPVLYLGQVEELGGMVERDGWLDIGATVTLSDAAPRIAALYPDFGELLRRYGALQVRNIATLGGNVANGSPIGDSPPPLIALGARVVLCGPDGERELPIEDFFIDYGRQDRRADELLVRLRLPLPARGQRLACYKVSKRFDQDISAVCAAFLLEIDEKGTVRRFRSGFGGMAATPKRALALDAAIQGQAWTAATVEAAAEALEKDFSPIDDHRASAAYRRQIARNLLSRLFLETGEAPPRTRLFGTSEHTHGER